MAEKIRVVGVAGRVAFTAPTGGKRIPEHEQTLVARTPWIDARLAEGDIVRADAPVAASTEPAPKAAPATQNKGS